MRLPRSVVGFVFFRWEGCREYGIASQVWDKGGFMPAEKLTLFSNKIVLVCQFWGQFTDRFAQESLNLYGTTLQRFRKTSKARNPCNLDNYRPLRPWTPAILFMIRTISASQLMVSNLWSLHDWMTSQLYDVYLINPLHYSPFAKT